MSRPRIRTIADQAARARLRAARRRAEAPLVAVVQLARAQLERPLEDQLSPEQYDRARYIAARAAYETLNNLAVLEDAGLSIGDVDVRSPAHARRSLWQRLLAWWGRRRPRARYA